MRKRFYLLMSVICALTITAACTDNGDDTPVEVEFNGKVENNTDGISSKINTLLKEV